MASFVLLAAGSNGRGQLASGNEEDLHTFSPAVFQGCPSGALPNNARIVKVVCGANHTLALLENATDPSAMYQSLWGSGDCRKGQLGYQKASTESITSFQPLDIQLNLHGLEEYQIKDIAAAWETSYIVLSHSDHDDALISFGADDYGDLGRGSSAPSGLSTTHLVDLRTTCGLESTDISKITVKSMSASVHHIIVHVLVARDNECQDVLLGWGMSRHGQVGELEVSGRPIPFLPYPRKISLGGAEGLVSTAVGFHHSVILHSSGEVVGLGTNRKKQIEGISSVETAQEIGCSWHGTYIVLNCPDGWSLVATGDHSKGQLGSPLDPPQVFQGLSTVQFPFTSATHHLRKLACGSEHVLCLFSVRNLADSHPEVWAWGWNEHGNIGTGDTKDVSLPIKIWPSSGETQAGQAVDVWAGCGTSWILIER